MRGREVGAMSVGSDSDRLCRLAKGMSWIWTWWMVAASRHESRAIGSPLFPVFFFFRRLCTQTHSEPFLLVFLLHCRLMVVVSP